MRHTFNFSPLANASAFIITSFFSLLISIVILRFLIHWRRIHYYNSFANFVMKITNPLLPIHNIIPCYKHFDLSALLLLFLLQAIEVIVMIFIRFGKLIPTSFHDVLLLVLQIFCGIIDQGLGLYTFMIVIIVILNLISSDNYNPIKNLFYEIIRPVLHPIQKILPPMDMIDLSPFVLLLILGFVKILLGDFILIITR